MHRSEAAPSAMPVERFPSPLWHCWTSPSHQPSPTPGRGASPSVPALTAEDSILPGPQQSHAAPGPSPPGLSFSLSESPPSLQHPKQHPPASTHHITLQPGAQDAAASSSKVLLYHHGITLLRCGMWLINSSPHPGVRVCQIVHKLPPDSREQHPSREQTTQTRTASSPRRKGT